jgi:hypothetical protein
MEISVKRYALCFLVPLFAIQTGRACAHTAESPKPQLALSVSEWREGGFPSTHHALRVVSTNISDEDIPVAWCVAEPRFYKLSVLYNGIPLKEKDKAGRLRREAEERQTECPALEMKVPRGGPSRISSQYR